MRFVKHVTARRHRDLKDTPDCTATSTIAGINQVLPLPADTIRRRMGLRGLAGVA
jgi:hypothetical protein